MDREDFTEGSISQIIFDFWDGRIKDRKFYTRLNRVAKKDLVEFIIEAQQKGLFGNRYIHE